MKKKVFKWNNTFYEIYVINRFKGCGCTIFCDISQKTYKSLNTMKDLNYYIIIGCDDDFRNFSAPISINKPIARTAFGIQNNDTNVILFCRTSVKKKPSPQFFFPIFRISFEHCLRFSLQKMWKQKLKSFCMWN